MPPPVLGAGSLRIVFFATMVIHTVLILGLCARWVNALAFAAPTVTQYGDYAYNGWTPALTKAPEHQLLQRQEVIEGLDSTIWRAKSYLFGSYYDYYYTTGTRGTFNHLVFVLVLVRGSHAFV